MSMLRILLAHFRFQNKAICGDIGFACIQTRQYFTGFTIGASESNRARLKTLFSLYEDNRFSFHQLHRFTLNNGGRSHF